VEAGVVVVVAVVVAAVADIVMVLAVVDLTMVVADMEEVVALMRLRLLSSLRTCPRALFRRLASLRLLLD
jgi:hypothetical protein